MRSQEFHVTMDSASFIRGSDNETNALPELRGPSFRGPLRFWLRAVTGGVIGDLNLDGLHKIESALFGSTELGSAIRVELRPIGNMQTARYPLLPHHDQAIRTAFRPGNSFSIKLSETRPTKDTVWQAANSILKLMITFGGVGNRSRRGYGAMHLEQIASLEAWNLQTKTISQEAIESINNLALDLNVPILTSLPAGPCKYPCINRLGKIRLLNHSSDVAQDEVKWFMEQVHNQHTRTSDIRWLGYGMGGSRQASPLIAKPVKINDAYHIQLVTLPSQFEFCDYGKLSIFLAGIAGTNLSIEGWNE
jgi:CRISPR-associated protein Cmr1